MQSLNAELENVKSRLEQEEEDQQLENLTPDVHDATFHIHEDGAEALNQAFEALTMSPIVLPKGKERKFLYAKKKVEQLKEVITKHASNILGEKQSVECSGCEDQRRMFDDLKNLCKRETKQKKIQILTLVPESWSRQKIAEEFGVTIHMVRTARKLKEEKGILALPDPKLPSNKLDAEVKTKIIDFYHDDEFTRICPGKKDFVSVRDHKTGLKEHVQKRLILCNLNELHAEFELQHKIKIGLSTFCKLRPKWCVNVGSPGMHNVCVCTIHQDPTLMLFEMNEKEYRPFLSKLVCDITNKRCMLGMCEECPGRENLVSYLKETDFYKAHDDDDIIVYSQWMATDRAEIIERRSTIEDFIDELAYKLEKLAPHDYIAHSQNAYLKNLKLNLDSETAIIILDFSENYHSIVQDSSQQFYFDGNQATVHPFAIYYKDNDELKHLSLCVISECMKHDIMAVYTFQSVALTYLKHTLPLVKSIQYFSDGAVSQYKNFKNISNLLHHFEDFGLHAVWNFFATSHGKGVCDGIGGTVKRLATRASLQKTRTGHILTAKKLFTWVSKNVSNIKTFYVTNDQVESTKKRLEGRFKEANKVDGIREHHQFIPIRGKICVKKVSIDLESFFSNTLHEIIVYNLGQVVAVKDGNDWWLGTVIQTEEDNPDVRIKFFHPSGESQRYHWPRNVDTRWVPSCLIFKTVEEFEKASARSYKLSDKELREIREKFFTI